MKHIILMWSFLDCSSKVLVNGLIILEIVVSIQILLFIRLLVDFMSDSANTTTTRRRNSSRIAQQASKVSTSKSSTSNTSSKTAANAVNTSAKGSYNKNSNLHYFNSCFQRLSTRNKFRN